MKIVFGLGNFGDKYAYTYHNMGFLTAECLADKLGLKFKKRECDGLIAEGYRNGEKLLIVKPLTYMNLSGLCVKQVVNKYRADMKDVIVVFDDIDIERLTLRVRKNGSGGTHNGMRNIIETMKTQDFPRVRIGVGRPQEHVPLADYVLSEVPRADRQAFYDLIDDAATQVLKLIDAKESGANS